ncbi:MAG TPA: GTPase HflX, partial [Bacteroidales bacterium]|nr:GTPase HflX [Bacteroidales bacterium]
MIKKEKTEERAVLIGVVTPDVDEATVSEYLDELAFLTETAGAVPVKRFSQKVEYPNPRTFVNKGKIEEIASYVSENEIDIAIFDDDLSPSQIRNIEKILNCRILDRTNL